jgi:L-lactate dehydrogenase complex protein LldG
MLGRIRRANAAAGQPGGPPPAAASGAAPAYRTAGDKSQAKLLDLLAGRLTDYRAAVRRCPPCDLGLEIAAALTARGVRRIVIPAGLAGKPGLAGLARDLPGVEIVTDDPAAAAPLDAAGLDACDGAVTGAAVAIAETGTIVLDASPGQGRRAISLIPDYHLCIVGADQVVELVPEAIALLAAEAGERPLTWISGPSATSDIELERVEGVHGPRTLEVIIVEPG